MKILITGGAGYIGSVLTTWALENNYKVRVLDNLWFDKKIPLNYYYNANYEFFRVDLLKAELGDYLEDVDIIIHAAAVVGEPAGRKFPELTKKVNYEASLRLIDKAKDSGIKGFIFLSTCSNYGSYQSMAKEDMPLKPLSLYAETKVGVERYLMNETQNLDWVICRLSTVYGVSPRMRFDLTINDFAMTGYLKKYLDIFLPLSFRPYIHVFDVAKVILKIAENISDVKNNVFNVGFNGENYKKIQIAEFVKNFISDVHIEIIKKGADFRDYQVDFSKLKKFLNIEQTFSPQDGIREVLSLLRDGIIQDPNQSYYYNTNPDLSEGGI